MIRLIYIIGIIYGAIFIIAIISMDYNVKSIPLHDTVIDLKLALQDIEEENQQLTLKRNTMYSLKNIHNKALSQKMIRPKRPTILHLVR